jgi:hypothetical protein
MSRFFITGRHDASQPIETALFLIVMLGMFIWACSVALS